MNPKTHEFEALDTPEKREAAKDWTQFTVGEEVTLKGAAFIVTDTRPKSMVLKPKELVPYIDQLRYRHGKLR